MRCALAIVTVASLWACSTPHAADDTTRRDTPKSGSAAAEEHRAEDPAILRTRAHFAQIEREVPGYRCRTLDLQGFSAEGGGLEACYAGNELRRLSTTYLGESGRGKEQYYFWGDSLEFLIRHSEHYSQPLSGKVVSSDEDRFYWSGGRLIRWVSGSSTQPLNTPGATDQERTARETARKFVVCAANMAVSVCEA